MELVKFIIYGFSFVFGTVIFSFLNVLVYRIPEHISFVSGRSFCPSCKTTLMPIHMVPILSYIFLGGKCAVCKARISPTYPVCEAFGGAVALLVAWKYQVAISLETMNYLPVAKAALAFAFLAVLFVIARIDAATQEIPDGLNIAVAVCGFLAFAVNYELPFWHRLIGLVCISLPMLVIMLIKEGAFGGGDLKLTAAVGLFLGFKLNLFGFFVALLIGGVQAVILLLSKKKTRKEQFAFGPAICAGAAIALFIGDAVIEWYLGLLL